MKLFKLVASALGLAHAAEDVAGTWQDASDADLKTWRSDVLHAASTAKQIKNKSCQLPKGKNIAKLGDPTSVRFAQSFEILYPSFTIIGGIYVIDECISLVNKKKRVNSRTGK